jgi:hypothetical protein
MIDEGVGVSISKNNGEIYTAGYFNGSADFGTGAMTGPFNCQDGFLIKYGN